MTRLAALALALAALLAAPAAAQQPVLEQLAPPGATRGTTLTLELRGKALGGALDLAFDRDGVAVESLEVTGPEAVRATLAVAPDAPLGPYAVRVRTSRGLTGPLLFQVGALPIVSEVEPNASVDGAQPLPLGVTVHGELPDEDEDLFALAAPPGTPIRAVVEAVRLGAVALDPLLELLDANGALLAVVDDDPLVRRDALIEGVMPSSGRCVLRVRDASRAASRGARYRLHVDAGAQPRVALPLALASTPVPGAPLAPGPTLGARLFVGARGPLGTATPEARDVFARAGFLARGTTAWWPATSLAPLVLRVSAIATTYEVEPRDESGLHAPEVAAPCAFEGALSVPGDADVFSAVLEEGRAYEVSLWARRLRSPLDGVLEVRGPDGRSLAQQDDSDGPDPVLRINAKATGAHTIHVSEHLGGGAPAAVYRLEVVPVAPRVHATVAGSAKERAVPRGGRVDVTLALDRAETDAVLAVALGDLPAGVTAIAAESPTGAGQVVVVLEAAPDAPLGHGRASVSLAAAEGAALLEGSLYEPLVLAPGRNNTVLHAHVMDRLTIAVTEPAPFTPAAAAPRVPLVRSGRITIDVDIERAGGFAAPLTASLVGLPAGVRAGGPIALAADGARATFTLEAAADARLGPATLVAVVEGVVDGTSVRVAGPVTPFEVAPQFLTVKARGAAIEQGASGTLDLELTRAEGAPAVPPELHLVGLPHDVTATPFTLGDGVAARVPLAVGPAAPQGVHRSLALEARFATPEGLVVQTLGGLELRVQTPAPPIPAAAEPASAPPASRLERLRAEHAGRLASLELAAPAAAASSAFPVALTAPPPATPAPTPTFGNDVLPVLTARGCNAGACHGASQGQDGFHLSLFGYDAAGDHFRITAARFGRRIDLGFPEQSLLLTKASGAVPHSGGALITAGDEDFRTLAAWIRAGAPPDPAGLPKVTGLALEPNALALDEGASDVPLRVVARYADGSERDVTRLALLRTDNAATAALAPGGAVRAGQRGEAFVTASFATETVGIPVVVRSAASAAPWADPADLPGPDEAVAPLSWIDALVDAKLAALAVPPSPLCTDEEFLRRATLDLVGLAPTPDERAAFLADSRPSPQKRAALVDALVARPEFIDQWVMRLAELMRVRSTNDIPPKAAIAWFEWLQAELRSGTRIDAVVRAALTAEGSTYEVPATNLFLAERDPKVQAENVAQALLGLRISCAQCHNHPFDRWTQDDYSGFVAFFARVRTKRAEDPAEWVVFDGSGGETRHPVTNAPVPPRFLGGAAAPEGDRREVLAAWLTAPDNPWFARNVANRVWAAYLGRGVVEPVDDVRVSNPASNEPLLAALAARLVESGFDLADLAREITQSRAYQRSSRTTPENEHDTRNFAAFGVRRLRAETLADTLAAVTEAPDDHARLPRGARAALIADGADGGYFLKTFGRAPRESVCACEVSDAPSLSQALHLVNGSAVNERVTRGGVARRLVDSGEDDAALITALVVRALGRAPTPDELAALVAVVAAAGPEPSSRLAALEDVFAALLSSTEFLFQH